MPAREQPLKINVRADAMDSLSMNFLMTSGQPPNV